MIERGAWDPIGARPRHEGRFFILKEKEITLFEMKDKNISLWNYY